MTIGDEKVVAWQYRYENSFGWTGWANVGSLFDPTDWIPEGYEVRPLIPQSAYAELAAERDNWKSQVYDEVSANLAFREAGGALVDEDMPTFCARLLAEKQAAESQLAELRVQFGNVSTWHQETHREYLALKDKLAAADGVTTGETK